MMHHHDANITSVLHPSDAARPAEHRSTTTTTTHISKVHAAAKRVSLASAPSPDRVSFGIALSDWTRWLASGLGLRFGDLFRSSSC